MASHGGGTANNIEQHRITTWRARMLFDFSVKPFTDCHNTCLRQNQRRNDNESLVLWWSCCHPQTSWHQICNRRDVTIKSWSAWFGVHAGAVDKMIKMLQWIEMNRHPRNASPWLLRDRVPAPRGALVAATLLLLLLLHHGTIRLSVGSLIGSIMEQNAALASFAKAKGERILIRLRRKLGFQTLNQSTVDFHSISFREALAKANVEAWTASCT